VKTNESIYYTSSRHRFAETTDVVIPLKSSRFEPKLWVLPETEMVLAINTDRGLVEINHLE
jgi:hypothetical protein